MSRLSRPTRRLNLLLLAALVHYLSACPCGCLEHHAWYQAFASLLDHDHDHVPDETPVSFDADDDAHSCHDCGDLVFASSRNTNGAHILHSTMDSSPALRHQAATPPAVRGERLKSLASANAALGICAELAVLQI